MGFEYKFYFKNGRVDKIYIFVGLEIYICIMIFLEDIFEIKFKFLIIVLRVFMIFGCLVFDYDGGIYFYYCVG